MSNSLIWYNNLCLPLLDLGHEVILFNYDLEEHYCYLDPSIPQNKSFIESNRPILEENLLRQLKKAHQEKPIDLFFSYFFSALCRPEIIKEIGDMGICTVNWYCNASYQFHLVEEIAPAYNYCLVPEKFRLIDYKRIGANPIYVQEAANPNIYKPQDLSQDYDVTFVGQKYGDRPIYIKYLYDNGIDIRVWGPGWQNKSKKNPTEKYSQQLKRQLLFWRDYPIDLPDKILGPPLSDEQLIEMYSRSKISLGFSSCGETHKKKNKILQIRLRDFEAPMSGAFYMVEYMEEIEEFFVPGKEIVCYQDKKDLKNKIKYYLSHDDEREQIRKAGYKRALNDHTWHKRFQDIFNTIGVG